MEGDVRIVEGLTLHLTRKLSLAFQKLQEVFGHVRLLASDSDIDHHVSRLQSGSGVTDQFSLLKILLFWYMA